MCQISWKAPIIFVVIHNNKYENKSREKYNSEKNTETNSREEKTIKKKKMPPPPSMNFNDLLNCILFNDTLI